MNALKLFRQIRDSAATALLLTATLGLFCVTENLQAQGTSPGNGYAILSDGRVFQGKITEVPGGYRISTSDRGEFVLPFDQISVTSASLAGAYEAYRDSIKAPTAETHLMLAEWCQGNGLWPQAYAEVQAALKLEPNRRDALLMLKRLDSYLMRESEVPAAQGTAAVTGQPARVSTPPAPNRSVHVTYMTRVQPILMNACGNGGCHGQIAENEFRLKNVRLESRNLKLASEENLVTLQTWIDLDHPEKSPLLTHAMDGAPHHRALFAGRKIAQYQILENWIRQYAAELKEQGPTTTPNSAPSAEIVQVSGESPSSTVTPAGVTPAAASVAVPGSQAPELQRARQQMRRDAFDPNAFNAMMQKP